MIVRGSRYEYADVVYTQPNPSGDSYATLMYHFDVLGTLTYTEYVWKSGDRLDLVAGATYSRAASWWMILEHNPEIEDPLNIPAGTILRIPVDS